MTHDLWADVFIGLSLGAAIWFAIAYCWRPPSIIKTIVKTGSVLGLSVAGFLLDGPYLLIIALAFGAVGDFCLSRLGKTAFLAGLVAFAAAHLAYVALLAQTASALAFTWLGLLLALLAVGMAALLFRHAGALRWPVIVYVAIIAVMGQVAIGLPPALWLGLIAALCFILSDSVLGLEMFVFPDGHPLRRITPFVVWVFYWVAQYLFLLAFAVLETT